MRNRFAALLLGMVLAFVGPGLRAEDSAKKGDGGEKATNAAAAEKSAPIPPAPENKPDEPKPKQPASTPEPKPDQPAPKQPASTPEPKQDSPKPVQPVATPDKTKDTPKPGKIPSSPVKGSESADAKPQSGEFPTPAELIKQMRDKASAKAKLTKVAHFDLAQPIVEKPADFSLFGGDGLMTLRSLVERIHLARDDKSIRGVLITLGQSSLNYAQAQEIRDALGELRKAGKKTFVYADNYDTTSYTIASGATDICLLAGGEIMIPGIGMEAAFYKGTLDKVGVQADYVQIGEYKGAEEPYTRTAPTPELKEELTRLVDSLYEQIVDGIAVNRNLSKEEVKRLIDDTIVPAVAAKDRGFIDHLLDVDELRELMKKELGNDIDLVYDFGKPEEPQVDFSNPFALLASINKKPAPSNKPAVALIYAEGTIVDGEVEEGLLGGGGGVGSASMRRTLRTALKDDNIKAVVIRIDSPGGSALASEVMWQAARHVAEEKPVIISIGSMAASGGYYLASAGDHIFADPSAIVGSIGVVGGKFVLKGLYDKLGLTSESFYRGKNADLFSDSKPFDDHQRRLITNWMRNTYEQFTSRILHTRKDKIKDIDKAARGRIFLAKQAMELGLIDEIGGLEAALTYAANEAELEKGGYDVKTLPTPKTLADLLMGGGGPEARFPFKPQITIAPDSVLHALSPQMRRSVSQQLQFMQIMQDRPVALVAPYVLTVK